MNPGFWSGKKVFLTGHTGFKGSWLSIWLQYLGADVTGYSLQSPTSPSLFELANVEIGMNSLFGDVRDASALSEAVINSQPEIVIHMAAQSLVRESYVHPVQTYSTNVMGVVNLFEAVRQCPSIRAVINVTTDKCYENQEWLWGYRENERMGGYDPYSNSKACAELVTSAYRNSFFNTNSNEKNKVAVASVRSGNVIGGGDWAKDRLIPDIVDAFLEGKKASIRYPGAIRPWQHVLEPLGGYLLLAEKLWQFGTPYAEAWNFGPADEDAKSVSWIADRLSFLWGEGAGWYAEEGEHLHEAHYLKLDTSKARMKLHWRPRLRLENALELIVDWMRFYQQGMNVREISLSQIQNYQNIFLDAHKQGS